MTGSLKGKIALITGGCSGLGAATVNLFEREGAQVVIADVQVEPGEQRAKASPGTVAFVKCDVTQEADIAGAIAFAQKTFGGLDILFNNAGPGNCHAPIASMEVGDWDKMMALLLRAPMLGIKHAAPLLQARGGGSIINTSSLAALRTGVSSVAYSVAKAGTLHLTRMAAIECAPQNIRVNAICPGIFPTMAVGGVFGLPKEKTMELLPRVGEIFSTAQPLARAGVPDDIARTALFLASDASSFTTGQEFVVDGGMGLMGPGSLEFGRPDGVIQRMLQLSAEVAG